jgi:hypothetical protein
MINKSSSKNNSKKVNRIINNKSNSKTGSKIRNKSGSKVAKKIRSKTGSKAGSKVVSKAGSKVVSKVVSKAGSKSGSKVGSKTNKKTNNIKQIKKNLESIKLKLEEKNMIDNFWVITDRSDFKPLTKIMTKDGDDVRTIIHSIKEIRDHILDDKGEYYKGKKLSNIKIIFNNDILTKLNKINYNGVLNNVILTHKEFANIKDKPILSIVINIYLINDLGNIVVDDENTWGLKVNYSIDDFSNIKFKLKNVEVLMRLASDSVVTSDLLNGITYKNLSIQLNIKK